MTRFILLAGLVALAGCPKPMPYGAYLGALQQQHDQDGRTIGMVTRAELASGARVQAPAFEWQNPELVYLDGEDSWSLDRIADGRICFEKFEVSSFYNKSYDRDDVDASKRSRYRNFAQFTIFAARDLPTDAVWPPGTPNAIDQIGLERGKRVDAHQHWQILTLCGPAIEIPPDARYLGIVQMGEGQGAAVWRIVEDE